MVLKKVMGDKTLRTNLVVQGVGQFSGRLLSYVFFLYAARVLGSDEFGIFSFALSVGYLVCTLMDFGLDALCVKWVARGETERLFALSSARIVTVVAGLSIIWMVSFFLDRSIRIPTMLLGVGFCFLSFLTFIYSYFRGIEKMVWEALLLFGQRASLLVLGLSIFILWKSAIAASLAFSISLFLTFVVAFPILQKFVAAPLKRYFSFRKRDIADVLKEAYPLAMVGVLWVVYYRIDTIMLAGFTSMSEVGLYNGAYKMMEGLVLLPAVIMMAAFPRLSQYGVEKGAAFHSFFRKLFLLLLFLAFLITCTMYYLAGPVFDLVLGEEYARSIGIFKVLLVAIIAIYIGNLVTQAMIALDAQKVYMYVALVGAIVNICLNFFLIPRYGAIGAAWATVFTEGALTIACAGYIHRLLRRNQK